MGSSSVVLPFTHLRVMSAEIFWDHAAQNFTSELVGKLTKGLMKNNLLVLNLYPQCFRLYDSSSHFGLRLG